MSNKKTTSCSLTTIGFITFIIFLILKLKNIIAWSWIWVTYWIMVGFTFKGFLVFLFFIVIGFLIFGKHKTVDSKLFGYGAPSRRTVILFFLAYVIFIYALYVQETAKDFILF